MKYLRTIMFCIWLIQPLIVSSQNCNLDSLIKVLVTKSVQVDPQLKLLSSKEYDYILDNILSFGKNAIPYLIEYIDADYQYIDYHGMYSSYLNSEYCGIICAKIIERIIDGDFLCEKIYKEQKYQELNLEDMKRIKTLYVYWWEKINQQPDLGKSQRALSNSIYSWNICN